MNNADISYLLDAIHGIVNALDVLKDCGDDRHPSTEFQPLVLKLDYLYRIVVNLNIDGAVIELVGLAYKMLSDIGLQAKTANPSGYKAPLKLSGRRGRPTFDIDEEQLLFLLEQGFQVCDISSILCVSVRTVERRMSSFGLTVSGKQFNCYINITCKLIKFTMSSMISGREGRRWRRCSSAE